MSSVDPEDLLPCPYCGSNYLENLDAAWETFSPVMCVDCGARGPCRPAGLARMTGIDATDGIGAWAIRVVALLALLSGCGGQVAEDPLDRFVRAVCACHEATGDTWDGCPANVRSEATGANPRCLEIQAEAYERSCSPNPFPTCEW